MKADSHLRIGDVSFSRVAEITRARPPAVFFEDTTAVVDALRTGERWLAPYVRGDGHAATPDLLLTFQAFVLRSDGLTILVDPCLGNGKTRAIVPEPLDTSFLTDLDEEVGGIDNIDLVVCTHLHVDHVGWCTTWRDGRWVPTFPRARHLIVGEEWEFWNFEADREPQTDAGRTIDDSVRPIVQAGLVDFVESDHRITSELRFRPTTGHTPGHVSIELTSRGARALISGDTLHHPVQLVTPGERMRFDTDMALAVDVRRQITEDVCDTDTVLIGTHFAGPPAGHVRSDGGTTVFVPAA